MAADLARKCQLPNCQISNSHKFLHNIHGQQEQSFLHRLYKNLDCGVAEIHCILSEIDHSLPLPPAWPSARLPSPLLVHPVKICFKVGVGLSGRSQPTSS